MQYYFSEELDYNCGIIMQESLTAIAVLFFRRARPQLRYYYSGKLDCHCGTIIQVSLTTSSLLLVTVCYNIGSGNFDSLKIVQVQDSLTASSE